MLLWTVHAFSLSLYWGVTLVKVQEHVIPLALLRPQDTHTLERHSVMTHKISIFTQVARSWDTEGQCGSFCLNTSKDLVYLSRTPQERHILKLREALSGQSSIVHSLCGTHSVG